MPVTPQYPGVYVEEIPSGVRAITGVATSITAFIGRASRGPVNETVSINSFGDFERIFGGLWVDSSLGFVVRDFFLNGGSRALVVRLYHPDDAAGAKPSKTQLTAGVVDLEAAYEGAWGVDLRAEVDLDVSENVAASMGFAKADLFNLTIRDVGPGGFTEVFRNLSFKEGPRRVDRVLKAESRLVRWRGTLPEPLPVAAAGQDALTAAETALADARKALASAKRASPPDPAAVAAAEAGVNAATASLGTARDNQSASDGLPLSLDDFLPASGEANKRGLYALEQADLFNLLCLPPYLATQDVDVDLVGKAAAYCEKRRAFLLVDPPSGWVDKSVAVTGMNDPAQDNIGTRNKNAALFFPRVLQPNPLRQNQMYTFVPSGAVAGVFARTDAQRGVWKAPAGLEASLVGVPKLAVSLTDGENGELNPLGINCLRVTPTGSRVIWGARTLEGDDRLASEWKYIPVRRLALFLEESLYRGTQWVVFEPNDESLWAQIRLNVGAFMHNLFRQGAFQGTTPREAYFVKCDRETTNQTDINAGIVNIAVGFAPLKPAEFVIIKIQQMAGQIEA